MRLQIGFIIGVPESLEPGTPIYFQAAEFYS